MKRSFAWFVAGMLLLPLSLSAQRWGSLKGIVTDDAGIPLRGAAIRVIGGTPLRGDIAAPDGSYSVPLLRPGMYRIKATMVGRGPVDLPAVRIGAGRATVAHFTLTFAPIPYDTILVRASRMAMPIRRHASLSLPGAGHAASVGVAESWGRSLSATKPGDGIGVLCGEVAPTQTVGMLKGRVIDEKGEPIAGAAVIVEGSSPRRGAYSKTDGRYTIVSVRAGTYDLKASLAGYHAAIREKVRIDVGVETCIDFVLAADTTEKEVIVESLALSLTLRRTTLEETLRADSGALTRRTMPMYREARPVVTGIRVDTTMPRCDR